MERFWESKPGDMRLAIEAHNISEKNRMRLLAWHAGNLMQMWAKKGSRITVEKLLGESKQSFYSERDFDRWAQRLRERRERAGE